MPGDESALVRNLPEVKALLLYVSLKNNIGRLGSVANSDQIRYSLFGLWEPEPNF